MTPLLLFLFSPIADYTRSGQLQFPRLRDDLWRLGLYLLCFPLVFPQDVPQALNR